MKYSYFNLALVFSYLVDSSHADIGRRTPASVLDVGVIGPQGEVILYYKEGDNIIVKSCEPNTVLGSIPEEARRNCQGKTNVVPLESFKQALRNLVSPASLNVLKPLTPEEVLASLEEVPSPEQIELMEIELEKINQFISAYGPENANLIRRDELVNALRSFELRGRIFKKIEVEIERTINLIADQSRLALTKSNSDKEQFLYTVLKNFNPNQVYPCGLKGSIAQRISDCSFQANSTKEGFVLVSRSKFFKEVYKDLSTGLLWSDRLSSNMAQYDAEKVCSSELREVAGISQVTWRLPTINEYDQAEKSGIRKALPGMDDWFWTSSRDTKFNKFFWVYFGGTGRSNYYFPKFQFSVRCVAL